MTTTGVVVARERYRWTIFGAMCVVYFAFGAVLMAIPPMVTEVRTDLGLSRGAIGFAIGAWALLYVVTAPPAGRIVDRIGLHRSLSIGALLVAVSAALQAAAQGVVTLWLAIGVIGVGGPLVSLSAPKLVAVWFTDPAERPLAVGFYTSAPALGGLFALATTNAVLLPALGDWRSVLLVHAALNVVAAAVWLLVSGLAPAAPSRPPPITPPVRGGAVRALLASRGVRLAMALGIGSFFITHGLSAWLPNILEEQGALSPRAASTWAAVSLAVGVAARLAVPGLARPARRSAVLHAVMLGLAVAMVVLAIGPRAAGLVAAVVLGLRAVLSSLVVVLLMEAEGVTAANAGLAYGVWFAAVEVGGAAGPVVIGALGDSALGFEGALVGMAALTAVMMLVLGWDDRRA